MRFRAGLDQLPGVRDLLRGHLWFGAELHPAALRGLHAGASALSDHSWVRKETLGPFPKVNGRDFYKAGTQAHGGWRADNDSNAFYAEVNVGGIWQRMGGLAQVRASTNAKIAHMEWHQPHEVRFQVWAVDNR